MLQTLFIGFYLRNKGFKNIYIVCELALILLETPLYLYNTLVTYTEMTSGAFTLLVFHTLKLQDLALLYFTLASHNILESY